MFNESDGTSTLPIIWKSNLYTLTTDDAGIGILRLKQYMTLAIHFYSKGTGENFENFGFQLNFFGGKLQADNFFSDFWIENEDELFLRIQFWFKTRNCVKCERRFWDKIVVPNSKRDDPRYPHLTSILPRQTPIEKTPLFDRKKRDKTDDNTQNVDKSENNNNVDDTNMPPEIP
ncbi:uncharacterized protein TNCT_666571 [Trichonephila clavata]|uniref:Uncharacterized protein n=1 Tax=Trichonephila clavata TaxID=2740835 RepID=A0A8X6GQL4_TRICU|nr:uncharacterized protein TNCT_666571 [Trichonephila clavata]